MKKNYFKSSSFVVFFLSALVIICAGFAVLNSRVTFNEFDFLQDNKAIINSELQNLKYDYRNNGWEEVIKRLEWKIGNDKLSYTLLDHKGELVLSNINLPHKDIGQEFFEFNIELFISMKKKIIWISIFSLLLIFSFNYRFEIMYYGSTTLGYDKNKAEKYSFIFTHKPFQISKAKLRQFFKPKWQEEERLELAIEAKKNFVKHNFTKINSTDNKFFLEAFDNPKINIAYQNEKLERSNIWENKYPQKIWNINISNNKTLDKVLIKSSFGNFNNKPSLNLISHLPEGKK